MGEPLEHSPTIPSIGGSQASNRGGRGAGYDVTTVKLPLRLWFSFSWSRLDGKPGDGQQSRSARQLADDPFKSCRLHHLEDSRNGPALQGAEPSVSGRTTVIS